VRPFAFAIALTAAPAWASRCPAPEGGSQALADVDAARRLTYVTSALDRASDQALKWGGGWRATFQLSAAVQFGLAFRATRYADRVDLTANGIKATTAFLFSTVFRLPAERHNEPWSTTRPWDEGPLCARLAAAESALANDAKFERRGRGLGMQALGLGFNLAVGVTTYLMHRRLWSVALTSVTGSLVGQLRIYSQPTVAMDAEEAYLAGRFDRSLAIAPFVVPTPGGAEAGVSITF
jgi:hypothetical protein